MIRNAQAHPGRAILIAAAALCACAPAAAKDAKGLWFAGGTVGYRTTQDFIPSNADMATDPRPDYLATRETSVDDTITLGAHAGFGLSRWLLLQVDAGWFEGDIGAVDAWMEDTFPSSTNPLNPVSLNTLATDRVSFPFAAGTLRQASVTLSAIARFRPDGIFHPILGAGAGMLFMEAETSEDTFKLNERIAAMHVTGIYNESGEWIVPERYQYLGYEGAIPRVFPVTVSVDDSFAWHLSTGLEYEIHGSLSLVTEVRYMVVSEPVRIGLGNQDQTILTLYSEKLFREDGSLRIFSNNPQPPNPLIPGDPQQRRYGCLANTIGDFDLDGHRDDLCYLNNPSTDADDAVATMVIQGGEIDLSGFIAHVGLRWYF